MPESTQDQSRTSMSDDLDQDVRDAAKRLGVNVNDVKGTGTGGSVTKADIENHAKQSGASTPSETSTPSTSERS